MDSMLLKIENLYVHISGKEILHDISFGISRGEQWAILGEAGSGKSVFGHTLAGGHHYQGLIEYSGGVEKKAGVLDTHHRFQDMRNQSNFYYQQRYNSSDSESTITVEHDLSVFEDQGGHFSKAALLDLFQLKALLSEPLIRLSNGENKRLQILKAVLGMHCLLILDEPYTGLDYNGRLFLDEILKELSFSGQPLLLLSGRSYVPPCFNRFARLQNGHLEIINDRSGIPMHDLSEIPADKEFPTVILFSYPSFQYAVRMRNVHVQYGGKCILDGISWEVEKGSCWALTGQNGAGKSTLLSLITGDNPQAYANEIYLFDRKRGSGESIWEIKQKTGYLSPELELYFDPAATAFSALASGLFDTIGLFRQLTAFQEQLVNEWLEFLNCTPHRNRLLTSLPAGICRMILLGRAMIKTPPLLVLDEPCQGLDDLQTAFALRLIDRYCAQFGASLIFVSHFSEDFPSCIQHTLHIEKAESLTD